jgi:GNAT superfamily N-acetyltransferase
VNGAKDVKCELGGVLIRQAQLDDASSVARIQVEGWRTAYASFIPDQIPASYSLDVHLGEWEKRLAAPPAGTSHLVGVEAEEIVGICSGGPCLRDEVIVEGGTADYTAQVYGLYVAPALYRRGIGRRLLGALAGRLADLSHRNLCLWAFELNPYRGFYDRLGGRPVARAVWRLGETVVREMAYGWPEIESLIRACSPEAKPE